MGASHPRSDGPRVAHRRGSAQAYVPAAEPQICKHEPQTPHNLVGLALGPLDPATRSACGTPNTGRRETVFKMPRVVRGDSGQNKQPACCSVQKQRPGTRRYLPRTTVVRLLRAATALVGHLEQPCDFD